MALCGEYAEVALYEPPYYNALLGNNQIGRLNFGVEADGGGVDEVVAETTQWILDIDLELQETTSWSDADWRTYLGCLRSWSGELESFWDQSDSVQAKIWNDVTTPGKAHYYLRLYTDKYDPDTPNDARYYGQVKFVSHEVTVQTDEIVGVRVEFQGEDAVGFEWVT